MRNVLRVVLLALMLSLSMPAMAGPSEDAVAAYKRGDYAAALKISLPLANQGNAEAENLLGDMYSPSRTSAAWACRRTMRRPPSGTERPQTAAISPPRTI